MTPKRNLNIVDFARKRMEFLGPKTWHTPMCVCVSKALQSKNQCSKFVKWFLDGQVFVGFAISIGLLYNFCVGGYHDLPLACYLAHFEDLFAHQAWRWEVWHEFSRGQRPSCFKAPLLGAACDWWLMAVRLESLVDFTTLLVKDSGNGCCYLFNWWWKGRNFPGMIWLQVE